MARPLGPVIRLGPSSGGVVRSAWRRRRVSVRAQRRARVRLIGLAVLFGAVCATTALNVTDSRHSTDLSQLPSTVGGASGDAALVQAALPVARTRARYRYSVIPHGVFSARELNAAITSDPVVAAHYQTFDASRATLVPLDQPRLAYVSYRLGDRVFWTRHPVRLPAGELVLSDGREVVRARCGNRISAVPGDTATAAEEPDPILLDTAEDPAPDDPVVVPVTTPAALPGDSVLVLLPTVVGSGNVGSGEPATQSHTEPAAPTPEISEFPPIVVTPGPRVRAVPEPDSVWLLAAGLIGIGISRRLSALRNA